MTGIILAIRGDSQMLDTVKDWLEDLAIVANHKKEQARINGEGYTWYSSQKNKDIKRKFSQEGEKLASNGRRIAARSSGDSTGGEWLYDFTLREFDENNRFFGVPLAAEIELSDPKPRGLIYDFNKLLQSDADNKVFIFQQKYAFEFKNMIRYFDSSFYAYNHKLKSKFLVACWLTSKYEFTYKFYSGAKSNHWERAL
ncbi:MULTISPECIES: hypothetical protein [unclassified Marinobacter]|uniref:hypothetical protein n=1 Tax=unclassified Marinobacter TaxID=83889 RepID=UPI0011405046|nr:MULTISPECIES: hypothetical protein [unclassified Marinobacter]